MKNNRIKEVSAIADILPSMTRIKSIKFIGNPVVKASKYRDYLVILAKSLCRINNIQNRLIIKRFYPHKGNT